MSRPPRPTPAGPGSSPLPWEVPGWDEARAAGLLPVVPDAAPEPSVAPSARTALRDLWVAVTVVVAVLVLVMVLGGSDGRLGLAAVLGLLVAAAVGAVVLWSMVRRWGRAVLAETRRGYATATFDLGRFWLRPAPGAPWTVGWVGWDFSGVWVIGTDGSVRPPSRRDVLAPGFYPSPRGDGLWELWTGSQWSTWVRTQPERG